MKWIKIKANEMEEYHPLKKEIVNPRIKKDKAPNVKNTVITALNLEYKIPKDVINLLWESLPLYLKMPKEQFIEELLEDFDIPQEAAEELFAIKHLLSQSSKLSEEFFEGLQDVEPKMLEYLNSLIEGLSPEEKEEITKEVIQMIQEGIDEESLGIEVSNLIEQKNSLELN